MASSKILLVTLLSFVVLTFASTGAVSSFQRFRREMIDIRMDEISEIACKTCFGVNLTLK